MEERNSQGIRKKHRRFRQFVIGVSPEVWVATKKGEVDHKRERNWESVRIVLYAQVSRTGKEAAGPESALP